jgi:hypothetical protein
MTHPMRELIDKAENRNEVLVFYHFEEGDNAAEMIVRLILNEEKASVDLGQGRRMLFHKARVPNTQDHIHFQVKGANIAALNKDGTAHDRSHGIQLQKWALDSMATHYPNFRRPKDGIIESLAEVTKATDLQVITEGFEERILLPMEVMTSALKAAD